MPPDSSQIDKKILARGYWIATHRIAIKKWTTIALYSLITLSFAVFFIQFGVYIFRLHEWDSLVASAIAERYDWEPIHQARAPLDLQIGSPYIFALGDNRYDLVVEAYNPNKQWALRRLKYTFTTDTGEDLPTEDAVILPLERRLFSILNFQAQEPINSASFETTDLFWQKVTQLPHLSWVYLKQPEFKGREVIIDNGKQSVLPARVTWTVQNGSTLNIRDMVWQVGLYSRETLVSVIEYQSSNFEFLEERKFDIVINNSLPRIDHIELYPLVNVFDPKFSYLETDRGR